MEPDQWYISRLALAKGKGSIISRIMGSKLVKMVYKEDGGSATVSTSDEERGSWSASDVDVIALAEMAIKIEKHCGQPMRIEWVRDDDDGQLYIVEAIDCSLPTIPTHPVRASTHLLSPHRRWPTRIHSCVGSTRVH